MVEAGMDVARLNFSHGTQEQHAETAVRVREAAGRAGRPVAILQDLPGPKLRIGAARRRPRRAARRRPADLRLRRRGRRARRRPADVDLVAGAADGGRPGRRPVPGRRRGAHARDRRAARPTARSTRRSRSAARSPRARASTSRARPTSCPRCPRRTSRTCAPGQRIGVDMVALSFVRRPEDVTERPRAHARPAHRQDREAAGRRARRGDRPRGRLRDGRPRRPRASSCRSRRCRSSRSG